MTRPCDIATSADRHRPRCRTSQSCPARSTIASTSSASRCRAATSGATASRARAPGTPRASRSAPRSTGAGRRVRSRSARVRGNGNVEPSIAHEVARRALVGMARVPARVGRERREQLRRPDARHLVAVRVDRGDEVRVRRADLGRQRAGDALRSTSGPKSSRAGREMRSGNRDAGDGVERRPRSTPRSPRCRRRCAGTALGGGSTPSLTQRSRLTSAARSSGA